MANTPKVAAMEVYPVAGKDCMELNLSGATPPTSPATLWCSLTTGAIPALARSPGGQKTYPQPWRTLKHCRRAASAGRLQDDLRKLNEWLTANIKDDRAGPADL